jgi:glycosyltransferase involved in cell wall biosynthesis
MIRAEYFMRGANIHHSPRLIDKPDVSVILPTYYRGASGLLARAVESVLEQSFPSFELIILDDGSTDGTADILAEYVKRDNRIIHVRHDENCGLPALRVNEGLMMARGHYCAYQFDDDIWTKDALFALISGLESNPAYDVAYGKSLMTLVGGEEISLGEPFDYSKLIFGNIIANNSIVHRRSVFERFGGYDMHLVMRRLCDWDLWLRWGRHVRFLFIDKVVSLMDALMEHSLGKTVHYDSFVSRAHMALPRDFMLTPDKLKDYPLDGLDHLAHLGRRKTDEIWRQLIAPFQSRRRGIWPSVKLTRSKPLHVLVTKSHYDTTVDVTINNFREALADEFNFTFIPQLQVTEEAIQASDVLLLHRTVDQHAQGLLRIARHLRKCVIFLSDDDLLTLHELSDELCYLAPGTPCYEALESIIRDADLVVTFSRLMQESVTRLNPRNVRLKINIKSKWLDAARGKLSMPPQKPIAAIQPLQIAFAGGGARKEEFAVLWPAIVAASRQLGGLAEFHFWGFTPDGVEEMHSPVHCMEFTYSYDEYLKRLTESHFDIMIVPLFGEKWAKRAKTPIKYLEITAAGAVGIYSDVEPYTPVTDGVTGLKCGNSLEAWTASILQAAKLDLPARHRMLAEALNHVERNFTSEIQAPAVAATLEAGLLHAKLGSGGTSRKPRIAYFCHSPFLAGAENHLLRHAMIADSFQFESILVLPTWSHDFQDEMQARASAAGIAIAYLPIIVETEVDASREINPGFVHEIYNWLVCNHIAIAHSVTLMREVGDACKKAKIPHVASLYATESTGYAGIIHCDYVHSDSFLYANRWAEVLGTAAIRILSHVPDDYFCLINGHVLKSREKPSIGLFGTVQARKGHLQAIEAIGLLKHQHGIECTLNIYGYDHFFLDYLNDCKSMAVKYGIESNVIFHGFVKNTAEVLKDTDIVLCASDWESLPQVIIEGMAAKKIIVTPLVGGVAEVISNDNGIVLQDNSADSICRGLLTALEMDAEEIKAKLELAHQVVVAECTKGSVGTALFQLYQETIEASHANLGRMDGEPKDYNRFHASDADSPLVDTLNRLRLRLHDMNAESN